jgi:hypothetical protein
MREKCLTDRLRNAHGSTSLRVHEAKIGMARGQKRIGLCTAHDIVDGYPYLWHFRELCLYDDDVVVLGRLLIVDRCGDDRHDDAIPFQVAVPNTKVSEGFGARRLEVIEVVGVVNDAHRIALSIPNAVFVLIGVHAASKMTVEMQGIA